MKKIFTLSVILLAASWGLQAQTTVTLQASQDNSIYSENNNANGAGDYLFIGRTNNGDLRRALIQFDVSDLPSDATITNVQFNLTGDKKNSQVTMHRLTANWGEGNSDAGLAGGKGATPTAAADATWNFSYFDSLTWNTAGADFVSNASATATVSVGSSVSFSSQGLIADVQAWVDGTADNNGWILIGNENENKSAIRANGRGVSEGMPELVITYESATATEAINPATISLTLFPNPVSNQLTVDASFERVPQQLLLEIRNPLGHLQLQRELQARKDVQERLDLSVLPRGTYTISLRTADSLSTRTFVKR